MAYSINTYSVKKWDLNELFPGLDSPELESAFDNVEEQVSSFEGVRAKLNPDIDLEKAILDKIEVNRTREWDQE